MPIKTIPYDPAEDLSDPNEQAELLAEAFASGERKFIAAALGAVSRARGMADVAAKAGVTRPALYKALSETGDPQLSTLIGVVKALGLRLTVEPAGAGNRRAQTSDRRRAAASPRNTSMA